MKSIKIKLSLVHLDNINPIFKDCSQLGASSALKSCTLHICDHDGSVDVEISRTEGFPRSESAEFKVQPTLLSSLNEMLSNIKTLALV